LLNTGVFEFRANAEQVAGRPSFLPKLVDDLPDIPAMPETLLLMELGMHELAVDLREMSQLVLADLGASLQILRLAARECGGSDAGPVRMEDCIATLGLQACLQAASRKTVLSEMRYGPVFETWAHAREIAQIFRILADESNGSIRPEEAYLAGLCHGIGQLPELLGWDRRGFGGSNWAGMGLKLAERWSLPPCVGEFFAEMQLRRGGMRWSGMARRAHQMAARSPIGCPLSDVGAPRPCQCITG
jgi:hypothetical protein